MSALEPLSRAPGPSKEALRALLRGDEHQDPIGERSLAFGIEDGRMTTRFDVLGHLSQGELAQRGQLVVAEEVRERRVHPLGRVDLAGLEPQLELLRRQVDEHDRVCLVEDPIGEGLANADAR